MKNEKMANKAKGVSARRGVETEGKGQGLLYRRQLFICGGQVYPLKGM